MSHLLVQECIKLIAEERKGVYHPVDHFHMVILAMGKGHGLYAAKGFLLMANLLGYSD
jgi:hypothetical protein